MISRKLRSVVVFALVALLMTPGTLGAQDRDRDDRRGGPSTFGDGIRWITFSPLVVTRAGERVRVEMRGRPNGTATFGIQNVTRDQAMSEIRSGRYEGFYTVRDGDFVNDGAVVVRLQWRDRSWQERADRRIDIRTSGAPSGGGSDDSDRIDRISVAPTYVNRAGTRITVVMEGRGGGQAWFGIENVTRDRPMTEVRRRVYEGSYVVRAGDHVQNGAVVVRLERNGRSWQETANQRVTIVTAGAPGGDTDRIENIVVFPRYIEEAGTRIAVRMDGRAGGRAWFGIEDVTRDQPMSEIRRGVYEGYYTVRRGDNVRDGRVVVRLEVGGRTWQETADRTVTILTTGAGPTYPDTNDIRTIEVFPRYIDRAGTRVAVRMTGRSGGRAWFGIENVTRDQSMDEVRSGVYEGYYTVRQGDNVRDGSVVVRLQVGGRTRQETADRTITIVTTSAIGPPLRPQPGGSINWNTPVRILQPRPGQVVTSPFRVEIEGVPGSTVRIEVTYVDGSGTETSQAETALDARIDGNGRFGLTQALPTPLPNSTVRMRVYRIDADGRTGPVSTVAFTLRR